MIQELAPLLEALDRVSGHPGGGTNETLHRGLEALFEAVEHRLARLADLEAELQWRREQMLAAKSESARPLVSLVLRRSGLAKRVRDWEDPA